MRSPNQHGDPSPRRVLRHVVTVAIAILCTLTAAVTTASTTSFAKAASYEVTASGPDTTANSDVSAADPTATTDPEDALPERGLSTRGGPISRAEVISRAKYWYDNRGKIDYDMGGQYGDPDSADHTYRTDCSGFVSMALHLTDSRNTVTLPEVGTEIPRTEMQPGDYTGILGPGTENAAGHVRLFEKWADRSAGTYWAYDFGETPVAHQIYQLSTDERRGTVDWTAYRYDNIF
ncbi:hypothetical protein GCM10023195_23900 [Actinoallomurus liliacearum]|uniref:NlpC/P60 domain-containing protein n=1 Tax=Actinoallomurus liliacearum TaxID=1080073 RepID=A0ABP8TEZ0_9ACTN